MTSRVLDEAGHLTGDGLDDYVLQRLEDQTATRVEAHVRQCQQCAKAADALREVIRGLRSAKPARRGGSSGGNPRSARAFP